MPHKAGSALQTNAAQVTAVRPLPQGLGGVAWRGKRSSCAEMYSLPAHHFQTLPDPMYACSCGNEAWYSCLQRRGVLI